MASWDVLLARASGNASSATLLEELGYPGRTTFTPRDADMTTIELPRFERHVDLVRWLVRAGLLAPLAFAVYLVLVQFEAKRECRGGAFSAGFAEADNGPF